MICLVHRETILKTSEDYCLETIALLDQGIELVKAYSYKVCRVRYSGEDYILKASFRTNKEARNLKKARSVEGVTHIVHDYGMITFNKKVGAPVYGLLKEYAPGNTLDDTICAPGTEQIFHQMAGIMNGLHKIGLAQLDISGRNFVVSSDLSSVKLIDLDMAVRLSDEGYDWSGIRDDDRMDLEYLKQACRRRWQMG